MNRALRFFIEPEPPAPPTIAAVPAPPTSPPTPRKRRSKRRALPLPASAVAGLGAERASAPAPPVATPPGAAPDQALVPPPVSGGAGAERAAAPALTPPLAGPDGAAQVRRVITGAAVVGRPREAEPVAAALALALRRETRARAATVVVIGPPLPEGAGGGGAGRRLAARLEEHGLEARVRGRLAWTRLDPSEPELAALAWQVALVAAPVVFVVTTPRTAAIDVALAEQDLVVLVTSEPEGPLAAAGMHGLEHAVAVRPLGRGVARELSRAGVRPAPTIRRLLDEEEVR